MKFNTNLFRRTLICIVAVLGAGHSMIFGQADFPANFSPEQPRIPDHTFNLASFGAVADGKTLCTGAFQKAVAAATKAGGGIIDVPPGDYLTAPFTLASNLNLHLEKGATVHLSNNPSDYSIERNSFENCITVADGHDIAITGQGAIDGQGAFFWKHYVAPKSAPPSVAESLPRRPRLIELLRCSRVLVEDVTLENSPSFHLVPGECREVTIRNIHIHAPVPSPNTDGIDPSGFDFLFEGCTFDTGDDCIAVKGGEPYDPSRPACENFLITHCTFLRGHGMSIGSETYGGVRNLLVRDCSFDATEAGIRIKSPRGRGGLLENVTYENLTMKHVKNPVLITCYYPKIPVHPDQDRPQPVTDRTPQWRHIRITDVTSTDSPMVGQIVGLPEMPIEDVVFTRVSISAEKPLEIVHARGIRFIDCDIHAAGKPIILDAQVEGLY